MPIVNRVFFIILCFIFCFQGSPRTRTICSTCFGVSTRRETVQPFSCKSPSRTGLPTIHCFKRLEATSGVTSGLYCRPSLRSVVERFFHFPSSSSDVPVIPTSSPLSPDGKHRRTSPSTASGNPPAPVTSVPVSPLPPHRTKARCLSGCVRATPVLPKAGSAAPPHGRKRQTPLSPADERASPDLGSFPLGITWAIKIRTFGLIACILLIIDL